MRFSLFLFLAVFLFQTPAYSQASAIRHCGAPEDYDLDIYGDFSICDYYQRQLAYKGNADKFSRQLKKRRHLFAAPRNRVFRQYKNDLEEMRFPNGRMEVVGDAVGLIPTQ